VDHAHRLPFWFTIGDGRAANPWSRRGSVAPSIRGWSDDAARRQKRSPGAEPLDVWMDDDGHGRTAPTSIVLEERDRGDPVARRCRDEHEGEWDCQDGAFHEPTSPVTAGWFRPCTARSKHPCSPDWGSRPGSFRHPNVEPTLVSRWRLGKLRSALLPATAAISPRKGRPQYAGVLAVARTGRGGLEPATLGSMVQPRRLQPTAAD